MVLKNHIQVRMIFAASVLQFTFRLYFISHWNSTYNIVFWCAGDMTWNEIARCLDEKHSFINRFSIFAFINSAMKTMALYDSILVGTYFLRMAFVVYVVIKPILILKGVQDCIIFRIMWDCAIWINLPSFQENGVSFSKNFMLRSLPCT